MNERDLRISRALKRICERLEKIVEEEVGEATAVGLLVMPYSKRNDEPEPAEFQYISNAPRGYMHGALRALVQKWDGGAPSVPPHRKQ
jgi:hypothetical protein